MAITKKDVEHVARLARLALSPEETELYVSQMAKILNYVEKLQALDTKGVEPTTYTVPLARKFREDKASPSLPQEEILNNSPERAKGCFKVPRIIE